MNDGPLASRSLDGQLLEGLIDVLRWYADRDNYTKPLFCETCGSSHSAIVTDEGERAREELRKMGRSKNPGRRFG